MRFRLSSKDTIQEGQFLLHCNAVPFEQLHANKRAKVELCSAEKKRIPSLTACYRHC